MKEEIIFPILTFREEYASSGISEKELNEILKFFEDDRWLNEKK